jgi:hypothetical protein
LNVRATTHVNGGLWPVPVLPQNAQPARRPYNRKGHVRSHAVLCGAGHNLCMILRRLRFFYALILVMFFRAFDALQANNRKTQLAVALRYATMLITSAAPTSVLNNSICRHA